MAHNTLILGNGFDIALGYKTKYDDFVNSKFWPFKNKAQSSYSEPNLQNFIYDYTDKRRNNLGEVRWVDIEGMLRDYAISKNETGSFNEDMLKADMDTYNMLVSKLAEYLRSAVVTNRSYLHFSPVLKLIEAISKSNSNWKGYSFNYTDSGHMVDFWASTQEYKKPNIPFNHIHGRLDMDSILRHNIILGIDDVVDIPKEYKFLRKTWNTNFPSHNLEEDLLNSDQIVLYGLSFGEIDREYFRSFFNHLKNTYKLGDKKKGIHFVTYDEVSKIEIMENLEQIGLKMSQAKNILDINFYLSSNIGQVHEDGFSSLFRKIQD